MGVLTNPKQYIANRAVAVAKKVGDGIATVSALSPKQLQEIDDRRSKYFSEKPDMTGEETQSIIQKNMGAVGIEVYQAYLEQLTNIYSPVETGNDCFDTDNRIRYFDITRWVTNTEEHNLDKLVNVYHVLSEDECNIALIYHRTPIECTITIGVVNTDERNSDPAIADEYYSRITSAIKGNFPGTVIHELSPNEYDFGVGIPGHLQKLTEGEQSVAVVSNVASEKSEGFISQQMEKLLDGIVPEDERQSYSVILLAKPIKDQLASKNRLFDLYTALSPYTSWQTGFTYTESESDSSSASFGVNLGVSAGVHSTVSLSTGTNHNIAKNKTNTDSGGINAGIKGVGINYNHGYSRGTTTAEGQSESKGNSTGFNASANFGVSFARSSSVTACVGKNESVNQTYTNYGVKHTLEVIQEQIKRIEESSALGMWDFAAYVVSEDPVIVNNVAHMYLALTQGDQSYMTRAAVSFWDGGIDVDATRCILERVKQLQHPVFGLKTSVEDEWLMYPTLITPTTSLSGKELAKALNFPRKSVAGIPVIQCAEFGRDIIDIGKKPFNRNIELGTIYHMHRAENKALSISKDKLTAHTFVTGSTGSGKSNAIYHLLSELKKENIHFLVVEPAKGEYKDIFGVGEGAAMVYGTDPTSSVLLRVNPFGFTEGIHISEHLDRLVEIFNACWPMYAAMPAVLKAAIENSYKAIGWDLITSVNTTGRRVFPTFESVTEEVRKYLDKSEYSDENKGNYKGSLLTRLDSLSNGINGLVFGSNDQKDADLFDRDVIIDLSHVGSPETKSLIMGVLVMKLQEYRSSQKRIKNCPLKHVTILEEAHNLLKKTSTEQTADGSNLIGKAVEMLTNSIAEMRTYGEGFIIADQAPGLLDPAVIRNTNTKIIMRLPDLSDRELVGNSANLNKEQIEELARLPLGVAAVYQNDWMLPVLCEFTEYKAQNEEGYVPPKGFKEHNQRSEVNVLDFFMESDIQKKLDDPEDIEQLKKQVENSNLPYCVRYRLIDYLSKRDIREKGIALARVAYEFFDSEKLLKSVEGASTIDEWYNSLLAKIQPSIKETLSETEIASVIAMLLHEHVNHHKEYMPIYLRYMESVRETLQGSERII